MWAEWWKQQCDDQNRNDGIQIFHFSVCTRWWMWKRRLQSDRDFIRRADKKRPHRAHRHGMTERPKAPQISNSDDECRPCMRRCWPAITCRASLIFKLKTRAASSAAAHSFHSSNVFSISNDFFFSPYRFFGPSSHNFYMHGQHESDETRQKPMDVDAGRNGEVKIWKL